MVTSIIGIRTTRINGIRDIQTPLMGPQKRQQIMKAIHFFLFHLLVCCQAPRQLWAFFISAWRWSSGVLQSSRYLSTNCKTVLNLSFFRLLSMSLRKLFHFSWSFFLSSSAENLSKKRHVFDSFPKSNFEAGEQILMKNLSPNFCRPYPAFPYYNLYNTPEVRLIESWITKFKLSHLTNTARYFLE